MAYELKFEQFSGPIEKLLELIEEKKLEITRLSLAQVTADFLIYLGTLANADCTPTNADNYTLTDADTGAIAPTRTDADIDADRRGYNISENQRSNPRESAIVRSLLADFLVVASRLLLIKSKALLPNLVLDQEEEREIRDLEERLKIYQELKAARNYIKNLWHEKPLIFSREFLASARFSFYPPKKIKPADLKIALDSLLKELQKFIYETKDFKLEVINLEERMREFLKRLETAQTFNFNKLTDSQTKAEIITCFLVILHLIKDQLINVRQDGHFSEITIERII